MLIDSDVRNGDSFMNAEFYVHDRDPYKGQTFVRIISPGDGTSICDQQLREDHKERFPREWLSFTMKNNNAELIGTPLAAWHEAQPDDLNSYQLAELQILKFQTVEQLAMASDSQMQRIGMGATGQRERARRYLAGKNRSADAIEMADTKKHLAVLQQQMQELLRQRGPGRPAKVAAQ